MITEKKKQTIKLMVSIAVLALILILVLMSMIKYEVEGEQNMPFKLSKIIVISTAEGLEKDESESKWNFDIYQNNDVYFYIDSNTEDDLLIKSVTIDNIEVLKAPQIGEVKAYMPNSEAGRFYNFDEQFLVNEKLEYKGASQSSSTELEIGSKGGTTWICFNNMGIGTYSSNKDDKIVHDGTWLKKLEIQKEQVEFTVSFNYTIETTKAKYMANITLDLPTGDISKDGSSYLEKTDMSDIIFKRVK